MHRALSAPDRPVGAVVGGAKVSTKLSVLENLVKQVTGRVRWRETLINMAEAGVTRFVEIGTGKVLTGLVKRSLPDAEAISIETPEDVDNFVASLV